MPKFTNISDGPRGLHTVNGLVMVEAGQTVDVGLAKGEPPAEEWFGKPGKGKAAQEPEQKAPEPASADDIKAAIALLDAADDDHWTAAGAPAVDAISTLIEGKTVTRAAITEAAPDAKRPAPAQS